MRAGAHRVGECPEIPSACDFHMTSAIVDGFPHVVARNLVHPVHPVHFGPRFGRNGVLIWMKAHGGCVAHEFQTWCLRALMTRRRRALLRGAVRMFRRAKAPISCEIVQLPSEDQRGRTPSSRQS